MFLSADSEEALYFISKYALRKKVFACKVGLYRLFVQGSLYLLIYFRHYNASYILDIAQEDVLYIMCNPESFLL